MARWATPAKGRDPHGRNLHALLLAELIAAHADHESRLGFELRPDPRIALMESGQPIEVCGWQLPGGPQLGMHPNSRVIVHADGHFELIDAPGDLDDHPTNVVDLRDRRRPNERN